MITFIKTAIVTIIISFISGWLLDHYKSLAPKILCNIGNGVPLKISNRKVYAYIVTVTNISNKIIHELTINIQSLKNNLQVADAKITKGLKFNSSTKNNVVDISIPFLSKKDKLSVTLYVENHGLPSKPVITIRSPEKFKEVHSIKESGILSSLFDVPQNINDTTYKKSKKNKITFINKKALISLISIILLVIIGMWGKSYLKGTSTNAKAVNNTTVQQQSNNNTEPSYKSTGSKTSSGITTQNTDSKTSSGTTTTTEGTNSKIPSDETTQNTDSKTSSDETIKNTDSKASSDETTKNTDSKISSDTPTEDTNSKTSSDKTTDNTDSKTSSDKTTQNTAN